MGHPPHPAFPKPHAASRARLAVSCPEKVSAHPPATPSTGISARATASAGARPPTPAWGRPGGRLRTNTRMQGRRTPGGWSAGVHRPAMHRGVWRPDVGRRGDAHEHGVRGAGAIRPPAVGAFTVGSERPPRFAGTQPARTAGSRTAPRSIGAYTSLRADGHAANAKAPSRLFVKTNSRKGAMRRCGGRGLGFAVDAWAPRGRRATWWAARRRRGSRSLSSLASHADRPPSRPRSRNRARPRGPGFSLAPRGARRRQSRAGNPAAKASGVSTSRCGNRPRMCPTFQVTMAGMPWTTAARPIKAS